MQVAHRLHSEKTAAVPSDHMVLPGASVAATMLNDSRERMSQVLGVRQCWFFWLAEALGETLSSQVEDADACSEYKGITPNFQKLGRGLGDGNQIFRHQTGIRCYRRHSRLQLSLSPKLFPPMIRGSTINVKLQRNLCACVYRYTCGCLYVFYKPPLFSTRSSIPTSTSVE